MHASEDPQIHAQRPGEYARDCGVPDRLTGPMRQEDSCNVLGLSGAPLATVPGANGEEPSMTLISRFLDFIALKLDGILMTCQP